MALVIALPEEETLRPVEALIPPVGLGFQVEDTIIPEASTDLPEGAITEGVIPEGILIIEEGMTTIGEATPTIEAEGLPFTEAGHITEGGIPITGRGIRTMLAGHTTGDLVPGMLLLHQLST